MSDHIASKINHCSRLLVTVPPSTIMLYYFIVLFHLFSLAFVLPRVHFPDTEGKVARCLSNMYQVTIEARVEVAKDWINHELSLRSNIANTISANENTLVCNSRKLRPSYAHEYGKIIRYVVLNNALQVKIADIVSNRR